MLQGVLQEALSTKRFGPAQERFPHLEALNGIQSVVCYVWALGLLLCFPTKPGAKVAPITAYLRPAISNSIGPACGILALRNISYPAQVLVTLQTLKPDINFGVVLYKIRAPQFHSAAFEPFTCDFVLQGRSLLVRYALYATLFLSPAPVWCSDSGGCCRYRCWPSPARCSQSC